MAAASWLLALALGVWSASRMTAGLLSGETWCGPRRVDLSTAPRLYWLTIALDLAAFLLAVGLTALLAAHGVAP